jgi:hypothetical protein
MKGVLSKVLATGVAFAAASAVASISARAGDDETKKVSEGLD